MHKALSWGAIRKSACILAEITIRKSQDIVRAINWAQTHGADVINMSWFYNLPHELVDIAIEEAYQANVLLVAAAGNCRKIDACTDPTGIDYPASHLRVMAVGASDKNDQRQKQTNGFKPEWDSRHGPQLSVMAPGVFCLTTTVGGGFDNFFGTSAAAPHVAGLAALLMSWRPDPGKYGPVWHNPPRNDLTNGQVRYIIEASAEKVGGYPYGTDFSVVLFWLDFMLISE